jgi:CubicO group peptidase (beta-lactamase class C family)
MQPLRPETLQALPTFLDATIPRLMAQQHVSGTAIVVVHDGRIIFLRGYGHARLDPNVDVNPTRTRFRIGSVTKPLTALATLQLADVGVLDLHRDIRHYLPALGLQYPVTAHQLLTHTAGFGEKFAGGFTSSPIYLQPLDVYLRRYVTHAVHPGRAYSYSNTNYAVAGLLVERLGGLPYDQYMEERIFAPLGMSATTARQPPPDEAGGDIARGYRWNGTHQEPIAFRYTQSRPGGAVSATAADMGRLLLALLGDGSVDGRRILSPDALRMMLAPQYTPHPSIPAATYGLRYWVSHNQQLLHHDGTLDDHLAVLLLAPRHRFGIFAASNAVRGIGNHLLEPLLTHLFGSAAAPASPVGLPNARERSARFAGTYRDYNHTRNDLSRSRALMPMVQSSVRVDPDGAISWRGRRWREVEQMVFQSENGSDHIVFRENSRGEIIELHAWGATYERIGWQYQTWFHLTSLAVLVVGFVMYPIAVSRRRVAPGTPRYGQAKAARRLAVVVAATNLVFLVGFVTSLRQLGDTVPLPARSLALLSLPIINLALTGLLPAFAVTAWRERWWTRGERLAYSTLAACAVIFMVFLNYWKLLGFRY